MAIPSRTLPSAIKKREGYYFFFFSISKDIEKLNFPSIYTGSIEIWGIRKGNKEKTYYPGNQNSDPTNEL